MTIPDEVWCSGCDACGDPTHETHECPWTERKTMTLQVSHPVVDWYLAFDDLWELMRVNWQTHNPFTQSGMWDAGDAEVRGVVMVVDTPPYRGVMLRVNNDDIVDHVVIVTYGPKCNECGYQPYNALWFGGEDDKAAIVWGSSVITDLTENADENPPEKLHEDGCSHLTYPDDDAT